jgi:hypothetical protein
MEPAELREEKKRLVTEFQRHASFTAPPYQSPSDCKASNDELPPEVMWSAVNKIMNWAFP